VDGNKLRDALRKTRVFISCSPLKKLEDDFGCIDRDEICAEIGAILAEPVKNCEVGTVKEQSARFREFCKKGSVDSIEATAYCAYECPCGNSYDCKLAWAQMPYNEGGAK